MYMSFYLLCVRDNQKHFQVYWAPGSQNVGDYHTKHHYAAHHHAVCDIYLHIKENKGQVQGIQIGCVDPGGPWNSRDAALTPESLKRTILQTRKLRVNMRINVFQYVPCIIKRTQ